MEVVSHSGGSGFEGPEKRIEVVFRSEKNISAEGLRSLERHVWDYVVGRVNGVILHHTPGEHFDSYLISESSLFVYPDRVVMLTCGTTTLLCALPHIIEAANECHLTAQYIQFSRKNFIFPNAQVAPHTSFDDETSCLKQLFPNGLPLIMGPLHADHWNAFIVDKTDRAHRSENEQLITVYMHELDPKVAKLFEYGDAVGDAEAVTEASGIGRLVPGAACDAHCFDGCGYSVNAIIDESYFTMHITPEAHCSYASFETNMHCANARALIQRVLNTFRPRRAQTVIRYEAQSEFAISGKCKKSDAAIANYQIKNFATNEMETGMNLIVTNYARKL